MTDVRHGVLVVQSDPSSRDENLISGLRKAGFDAVRVGTAVDAYRCMLARDFSLFVVDAALPDADGLAMVGWLRTATDAGIVVLTEDRRSKDPPIRGLNDGADAYVAKPIDVDVLAATLRSLLRGLRSSRAPRTAGRRLSNWRLGTAGWDLISPDGKKVQLTQPERLLLGALAASPGQAVARGAIISLLARDAKNFDRHRLEMLVHRLRRKVLSATGETLPLKTVRGIGYALAP